ncbi:MAG: hypothetical protein WCR58_07300 [Bacteroidales bacterium]|jgi:hypothetical protein|nr:hypothetical protein [Bacteroidales bacterium]MDD3701067.1 hypothetical protein [Bacteroidales bacterium]MDY0369295.1 hypothetical protein [Bacteroidales bacterium]
MEDLIYILLILVWVVLTIVKSSKKNQKAAPSGSPQKPRKSKSLEEWLEEYLPAAPATQDSSDRPTYNKDFYPASQTDFRPSVSEIAVQSRKGYSPISLEYMDSDSDNDFTLSDEEISDKIDEEPIYKLKPFDLRQAIIYEAVLNRPYQ